MNRMHWKSAWLGLSLCLALSSAHGQPGCVTPQQNAVAAEQLSRNYTQANQNRLEAQATMRKCQARQSQGARCGREIDQFNLADVNYRNAAQAIAANRSSLCP